MLLKFMAKCSEMTRCSANKRSSLETFMWLIMARFPSFGWMQLLKKFTINWSSAYWSCFLELHRRRQGCRKGKEGLFLYWFCFHVLFFVTVLCIRLFPQIFLSSSLVGNSWSHKWTKIFWKRSIKCFRKKNMTVLFFLCKTIHTFGTSFSHFGIAMFVSNSDFVTVKSELHNFVLILYTFLESGAVDSLPEQWFSAAHPEIPGGALGCILSSSLCHV